MKALFFSMLVAAACTGNCVADTYKGRAWHDSVQTLPGTLQCEFYDEGGEGIAYHDSDAVNNGSGKLNPDDGSYLHTFRMNDGVDISYTKTNATDDNPYNAVDPKMNQLYVGWTEPGEWINYTVDIKKAGPYRVSLMYTANADGKISLAVDGKDISGSLLVRSTYNFKETVAWRQWHHWNKAENLATVTLPEGRHVLTLRTVEHGNMNYDYIEFAAVQPPTAAAAAAPPAAGLPMWYKPNVPLGIAHGIYPGRVVWGHNPKIASWDGKTGMWWEDKYNDQAESDRLLTQTLFSVTNTKDEKRSWDALFRYFNKANGKKDAGYAKGEKLTIKINQNNTDKHESSDEINANPQLILSLLKSLVNEAGIPQENITLADPSRFITDNIYDKCHAVFPKVHYVDHNGGDGREQAAFIKNGFLYSFDFKGSTTGLATCCKEAAYIINMAIMKGHVSQGVSLCAKNFFGCTNIEADWRKNSHSGGFSQSRDGKRQYSVYPDFMGHKDLGAKTVLFLIDGIYSNKALNGIPNTRWSLPPFKNEWPGSLFASQDGVAVESVVLDFALAAWPDAPDMLYSDHAMEEMALAGNPPSGAVYDPERDGTRLTSLGTTEHWNNAIDKQYSRNLDKSGTGIELVYVPVVH